MILNNLMEYPEEVRWINTNLKKSELHLPSEGDLLTNEDVQRMINVVEIIRDKAFIALLYESGCRVSEIGNLRLKHVRFDSLGSVITVFGKTGSRTIRVIACVKYLHEWLDNHPQKENRECYL